jgi:hypothetical protein
VKELQEGMEREKKGGRGNKVISTSSIVVFTARSGAMTHLSCMFS